MSESDKVNERDEGAGTADTLAPKEDLGSQETVAARTEPGSGAEQADSELETVERKRYVHYTEVARGGMGRIQSARDLRLKRQVAIKELLDAEDDYFLRRFEREALITARLQHPAIVPVYDAGRWPSGEPFYSMKLVSGTPLDKVIKTSGSLEDRLALLPTVIALAEAIAYAHSEGVIHRDLKPANVLVGSFGETVVIDWGLAKDLHADDPESLPRGRPPESAGASGASDITMAGSVLGTPAYMPPEQAAGEPVDERADVFALGAILYQVLSGELPYEATSATEMLSHVATNRQIPLMVRDATIPAELVAIVEHAMAPDKQDRYPSAREFAEELRRFQTGQLVGAHSYTTMELIRRWIRRHRAAVSVAVVFVLVLAAVSVWSVSKIVAERNAADAARRNAEERKRAAEQLVDYMVVNVRDELEPIGRLDLLSGVGARVLEYYRDLEQSTGDMSVADLHRWSDALEIIGQAQAHQGDVEAALVSYKRARDIALRVTRDHPGDSDWQHKLAISRLQIGSVLELQGKQDEATVAYGKALEGLKSLTEAHVDNVDWQLDLAEAHDKLGSTLRAQSELEPALAEYRSGLAIRERMSAAGNKSQRVRYGLSVSHDKIGSILQAQGKLDEARQEYERGLKLREELAIQAPQNSQWQESLAKSHQLVGELLRESADLDGALAQFARARPIAEKLARQDPNNASWQRELILVNQRIGVVYLAKGDVKKALNRYHAGLAIAERLVRLDPNNAVWQLDLSRAHNRMGDAHRRADDTVGALSSYRAAKEIRKRLVDRDKDNSTWKRLLAWSHIKLGNTLLDKGDLDEALEEMKACQKLRRDLASDARDHHGLRHELASANIGVARVLVAQDKPDDALEPLTKGIEMLEALVAKDPSHSSWQSHLAQAHGIAGDALIARGDRADAIRKYRQGVELYEALTAKAPDNAGWQGELADAYDKLASASTPDDAQRLRRQAAAIRRRLGR